MGSQGRVGKTQTENLEKWLRCIKNYFSPWEFCSFSLECGDKSCSPAHRGGNRRDAKVGQDDLLSHRPQRGTARAEEANAHAM